MKNILVFATTFPRFTKNDATPPFVYELSKRLSKLGLNIIVLTPRVPGSKKFEIIENMKIYRYSYFFTEKLEKLNDGAILPNLKQNKWLYFQVPFLMLFGFLSLIKLVKKEKIDTIHAHWIIPQAFLAVLYKKFFNKNIKILCTSHGSDINKVKGFIGTYIKKYTLKNIDKLTVVSKAIKKECLKLETKEEKIEVIPMGVDHVIFTPSNYDENIKIQYNITGKFLLFVGRLAEEKGIKYLIDAMLEVIKIYGDTKLLIVGHGPLEEDLKNHAKSLHLEKNIIFLGAIQNSDLPKYYATADIFINPSDKEGFGLVFVEAILSGCIAIGTNNGGTIDIIKDGDTGFLVQKKNSHELAEKIMKIFENNSFDKQKARELIKEKFSWDVISEKYFNLLNK